MATIQEIDNYYAELTKAFEAGTWYFTQNRDRAHNAAITRLLLEKSESLNMYCGEMSIFRKGFYRYIDEKSPGLGTKLADEVSVALMGFLERSGTRLHIILENYSKELFHDLIVPIDCFRKSLAPEFYRLPDEIGNKKYLMHFSFTPTKKMLRMEIDKEDHEGIFTIDDEEGFNKAKSSFEKLRLISRPIPLAI